MLLQIVLASVSEAGVDNHGPPAGDGPVVVNVGFYLSNINDISEENETFEFEGLLSLHWKDPRLAFDPEVTGSDEKYFQGDYQVNEVFDGWWPQLYLVNESGDFERQGTTLRITAKGDLFLSEEIDAVAKSRMNLGRFPFDRQQFVAIFEVLGANSDQVILKADPATTGMWQDKHHRVHVPQWREPSLFSDVVDYESRFNDGQVDDSTAFRVGIGIERNPWYMLRFVMLPVMIFVFLSWSVFWMDRSSLGDRMDISFIGILTVVAYQIISTEHMPKISYVTILLSFMIISFLTMCASVVVNLRVASHDQNGHSELGDRLDKRSRYLFPLVYFASCILVGAYIYLAG
ncbi:hypothetical protein ACFL00_02745 [Pseudomonadota bacterium]